MKESQTFYMCGVVWQHEIGHTRVNLYRDLEELKEEKSCTKQCGIVEIQATAKWIKKQNFRVDQDERD